MSGYLFLINTAGGADAFPGRRLLPSAPGRELRIKEDQTVLVMVFIFDMGIVLTTATREYIAARPNCAASVPQQILKGANMAAPGKSHGFIPLFEEESNRIM